MPRLLGFLIHVDLDKEKNSFYVSDLERFEAALTSGTAVVTSVLSGGHY
jgi:hypothetical protein